MKKLLFLIGLSLLVSCNNDTSVSRPQETGVLSKDTENYYQRVTEYTYEGCEYIKVGYGKSIWGSHKGNCKNPIHTK